MLSVPSARLILIVFILSSRSPTALAQILPLAHYNTSNRA
jgi:hypothetical protein